MSSNLCNSFKQITVSSTQQKVHKQISPQKKKFLDKLNKPIYSIFSAQTPLPQQVRIIQRESFVRSTEQLSEIKFFTKQQNSKKISLSSHAKVQYICVSP